MNKFPAITGSSTTKSYDLQWYEYRDPRYHHKVFNYYNDAVNYYEQNKDRIKACRLVTKVVTTDTSGKWLAGPKAEKPPITKENGYFTSTKKKCLLTSGWQDSHLDVFKEMQSRKTNRTRTVYVAPNGAYCVQILGTWWEIYRWTPEQINDRAYLKREHVINLGEI